MRLCVSTSVLAWPGPDGKVTDNETRREGLDGRKVDYLTRGGTDTAHIIGMDKSTYSQRVHIRTGQMLEMRWDSSHRTVHTLANQSRIYEHYLTFVQSRLCLFAHVCLAHFVSSSTANQLSLSLAIFEDGQSIFQKK